jgi:murein DD-endopeptidase MepM/ murein hydrolase activator NlpD
MRLRLRCSTLATVAAAVSVVLLPPAYPRPSVRAEPANAPALQTPKPYRLPFARPPGPATWYVIQWYGSTTGAYRTGSGQYSQGQGIHFGVDFAAPCGTEVVAIAPGTVIAADGDYGSPPHNLVIRHSDGNLSIYGHLLQRPTIPVGSQVAAGQPVALSGDPQSVTCTVAPHLHLEIRKGGRAVATNPVNYVEADWDSLSLGVQLNNVPFERDLDQSRKWQRPDDQPDIVFGGRLINQFPNAWPP